MTAPHGCDFQGISCINKDYNRKLDKMSKNMNHVRIIDMNLTINKLAQHRIHMNSSSKKEASEIIGHKSFDKAESSHQLKWKEVPTATSTNETMMEWISGNADLHKNAVRTSSRPKGTPITWNEDFFMDNEHIKNSVVDVSVRSGNCVRCKQNYEYNQNYIHDRNTSEVQNFKIVLD
jgi:hypothetical protein